MPPSQESKALEGLFKVIAANMPQDGNSFVARCVYDQVQRVGAEASGVSIEDVVATGNGLQVPCKWFKPIDTGSSKHVMLYMHGGAYSFGSPNGHRKLTAHLAKSCQCPALSVDYRLTPEHDFPAPIDDCIAAYKYLLDSGYEAKKIIVAGDSCGGCLSTVVPLACLQRGLPVPGASVSLSPCYDSTFQGSGTMDSNDKFDVLQTRESCVMMADQYVGGSGASKDNPLISPLFTKDEDAARLPPHWISVGGYDMLRDHGERMAQLLQKAGVEAVIDVHEGQQHVMEFMVGKAPEADASIKKIGEWVTAKFA